MNLSFARSNLAAKNRRPCKDASPSVARSRTLASIAMVFTVLSAPAICWAQSDVVAKGKVHVVDAWPRFLGPHYNGAIESDIAYDFSKSPAFVWSIDVGDGYGIGSVNGDRFYQMDAGDESFKGDKSERLRCFDLATGQQIWSQSQQIVYQDLLGYEDGPRASPTIAGNRVYTMGVTGLLTCRDTSEGKLVWSTDTQATYGVVQNFFGVASAPLVIDDLVIVMVGGSPPEDQDFPPMRLDRVTPNGSAVVAFDRHSGKEIWKCGDDLASYSSPIPAVIDSVNLVLVFARTGLIAIDPAKGTVRWKYDHRAEILESVNAIVPVVLDNKIFLSECYELGSVLLEATADSAAVLWKDPPRNRRLQSMRCHWATPVLADGFLYGCSGRNAPDSDFRCIDFRTGKVQWSDSRQIRSSVTRLGDHLLVLEERGLFQILKANPERLEIIAQWDFSQSQADRPALGYPCWSAPLVVGKQLLLRGTDRVISLEFATRD